MIMNVEKAVEILRAHNLDVVQTLEEYFLSVDGRLVMITEKEIKNHARAILNSKRLKVHHQKSN
jgi:hypothetical protein